MPPVAVEKSPMVPTTLLYPVFIKLTPPLEDGDIAVLPSAALSVFLESVLILPGLLLPLHHLGTVDFLGDKGCPGCNKV